MEEGEEEEEACDLKADLYEHEHVGEGYGVEAGLELCAMFHSPEVDAYEQACRQEPWNTEVQCERPEERGGYDVRLGVSQHLCGHDPLRGVQDRPAMEGSEWIGQL